MLDDEIEKAKEIEEDGRDGILTHCVEQQLLHTHVFLLHGILQRSVHGDMCKQIYIIFFIYGKRATRHSAALRRAAAAACAGVFAPRDPAT